jgi:hypothetical protein
MNTMASRPNKSGVFKRTKISDLLELAKAVPDKAETKEDLTVGELIPRLWPAIGKFLDKRYNYRDIAKWMIEQGVAASEDTLMTAIGDEARSRGKGRSSVRNRSGAPSQNGQSGGEKNGTRTPRRTPQQPAQAPATPDMNGAGSKSGEQVKTPTPQPSQIGKHTSPAFNEDV